MMIAAMCRTSLAKMAAVAAIPAACCTLPYMAAAAAAVEDHYDDQDSSVAFAFAVAAPVASSNAWLMSPDRSCVD